MQPHDPAFGVSCRHGHNLAIGNPSAGQDRTKLIFLRFPCPGDLVQGAIKDLLTGLVEIVADLGLDRRPEIGTALEHHVHIGRPVTGANVDATPTIPDLGDALALAEPTLCTRYRPARLFP